MVVPQGPADQAQKANTEKGEADQGQSDQGRPMRLGWAKLLKRVFNLDLEHCPNCGGELKIIAAILEVGSDTKGPEDRLCLGHARTSVSWQAQYREDTDALGS
jgi:hypothetical protein